jgi:hypothetical protein
MSDVHASVRFRDEETITELESAADEHGSRSEAIRQAVRAHYSETADSNEGDLPAKAREGHETLVEWTGIGGRIELDTAESILANQLNIQKEAVRRVVLHKLRETNAIRLHQGIHHVSVVVDALEDDVKSTGDDFRTTQANVAADEGEARERLEELATASTEVDE